MLFTTIIVVAAVFSGCSSKSSDTTTAPSSTTTGAPTTTPVSPSGNTYTMTGEIRKGSLRQHMIEQGDEFIFNCQSITNSTDYGAYIVGEIPSCMPLVSQKMYSAPPVGVNITNTTSDVPVYQYVFMVDGKCTGELHIQYAPIPGTGLIPSSDEDFIMYLDESSFANNTSIWI